MCPSAWNTRSSETCRVLCGTREEGCLCLVLDAAAMVGAMERDKMPFFSAVKHDELKAGWDREKHLKERTCPTRS